MVDDDVREYLALFYPQVAFGGTAFGGQGARSPFDVAEVPGAGHWLMEENPRFVVAELLRFLTGR